MRFTRLFAAMLVLAFAMDLRADLLSVRRDTQFPVELQTGIHTGTAQQGDRVLLRTTQGVLIGNNIVVPQGAEVFGTIDKLDRDPECRCSSLVLRFGEIQWSGGYVKINAVVSAVESTNQRQSLIIRHIQNLFSQKTNLEHIDVYAHIRRDAFTEFSSDRLEFEIRPGIRLVLRHLDPNKDPQTMVNNLVLNVNRGKN